MHYPHESNANPLDNFIVLQYPSTHSCNYFISFTSFVQIPYGHIDNIICRNPNFGLATKANGLRGCESRGSSGAKAKRPQGCRPKGSPTITSHTLGNARKCEGVWGSEHSHSQGNSHFGRWSPSGLLKLQRAISRVKTRWLVAFFISLESSWNVNV
jgi:hypothetical protein